MDNYELIELLPTNISEASMWAIVVGFFMPLIINFVINAKWVPWKKVLVAFLVSAVVGTITALIAGAYEGLGIPSIILLTLVVSITAYQNFWRQIAPNLQNRSGLGRHEATPRLRTPNEHRNRFL